MDFSVHSDRALRYATTLARRFGASVQLLHVVEDPFVTGAWSSEALVPNLPEVLDKLIANADRRLAASKAIAEKQGVRIETSVLTGTPAHTIAKHAKAGGFDLIVMGTHGRTGVSHVFMGSVAERVVRTAPCPVLTVRDTVPKSDAAPATAAATVA